MFTQTNVLVKLRLIVALLILGTVVLFLVYINYSDNVFSIFGPRVGIDEVEAFTNFTDIFLRKKLLGKYLVVETSHSSLPKGLPVIISYTYGMGNQLFEFA